MVFRSNSPLRTSALRIGYVFFSIREVTNCIFPLPFFDFVYSGISFFACRRRDSSSSPDGISGSSYKLLPEGFFNFGSAFFTSSLSFELRLRLGLHNSLKRPLRLSTIAPYVFRVMWCKTIHDESSYVSTCSFRTTLHGRFQKRIFFGDIHGNSSYTACSQIWRLLSENRMLWMQQ